MLPLELQKIKALKDQATTIAKRQPTVSLLPMVSELIRKGIPVKNGDAGPEGPRDQEN